MTDDRLLEEVILPNSYRNFHAKGFDYLCLKRSPELTLKAYFFEGNLASLPEVVMPHDHRYAFRTYCLAGQVADRSYSRLSVVPHKLADAVDCYDEFRYRTPLNGGDGFEYVGEAWLGCRWHQQITRRPGGSYRHSHRDIHTIQIVGEQTVLLLAQFADRLPEDAATSAFRRHGRGGREVSLDGLYDRMDADHALLRLNQVRDLMGVPEREQPPVECPSREQPRGPTSGAAQAGEKRP